MSIYRYFFLKEITSKGKKPYLCGVFVNLKSLIDSILSDNNNHFISNFFLMKKLFSSTKAYLLLAGAAALMASCQDYEPANEQMTKEAAYNYEFERQFGPVDPNHDWSMATRVTANIDLSDAPEGTYEVKIFSEKNGYLLTKAIVENSAQISFDAIKGENSVRILARKTSALGLSVINGYFPIVDGEVNTAKEGTRASTADNCETTRGAQITDLGTFRTQAYVYHSGRFNEEGKIDYLYSSERQQQNWTSVPNDAGYYITVIEGNTFKEGDNGKYLVTHDGETEVYDMYEIGELISSNANFTYYWLEGSTYYTLYWFTPAYYGYEWGDYPILSDFYYLDDVYKNIDPKTKAAFTDLAEIVSPAYPDTYFTEGIDNRSLYKDKLNYDIEYILKDKGPITFTPVFSGTAYNNEMGYFYWRETDDMTEEQKKEARRNAPRYVFLDNTFPDYVVPETGQANIVCNDNEVPRPMEMPTWMSDQNAIAQHEGHFVQGTTYHLAYFGDNYDYEVGKYEFPEGLHVGFFMFAGHHVKQNNRCYGLRYSIQEMNLEYGTNYQHWWAAENAQGQYNPDEENKKVGDVFAVTYSYKGTIVLGFEDDVDKDENDILYFVSAPIDPPIEITKEDENTWIVACEDLGGTYDYDFNDLVFEVTLHTTTTETSTSGGSSAGSSVSFASEVLFRPLAAGGTLPAKVYLGETEIGEIHALLGGSGTSTSTPINVGPKGSSVSLSGLEPTPVNTGETYYTSIAGVLEDIKIVVTNEGDKDATEITAPNQDKTSNIPQMLLLPKGWDWPTEQTHIYNVYPKFKNWAADMTQNGWIENPSTNSINTNYFIVNPNK